MKRPFFTPNNLSGSISKAMLTIVGKPSCTEPEKLKAQTLKRKQERLVAMIMLNKALEHM